MSASSCSSSSSKHDVFISFRGIDSRKKFIGHLYKDLKSKGINAFIDSEELSKGTNILELLKAVDESSLSIVVFSENYASSTWCLRELARIVERMGSSKEQIVVPIFYEVDPSDIRKLEGSFAAAFAKYDRDAKLDKGVVETWKSALIEVSNISGWDSSKYEYYSDLVTEVVEDISNKLIHISSSIDDKLVGMENHIGEMESRLCLAVDDVRYVLIWAKGGSGKSAIARATFNRFSNKFDHYCFLDVKEGFKHSGAAYMKEKLLTEILGNCKTASKSRIKRLRNLKIFLVLDGVDCFTEIEALLGKDCSFGSGSRIIVTTRNRESLSGVDHVLIYSPNDLSQEEARELFVQYAFGRKQPTPEFSSLIERAIKYAQGLPLLVRVLGSFLYNKSAPEWEDELDKLQELPPTKVHHVLRTSYDGLDHFQQEMFLDIACFYRGMDKGIVTKIQGCGRRPLGGLRVLHDRALITTSCKNIEMHDSIQEMGWEIVRQQSTDREPGRRSRLWRSEDVNAVLTQNTGTEAVESIILDLSNSSGEVRIQAESFVEMRRLRLLKIADDKLLCIQRVNEDFKFLSQDLRCLIWVGCPLKSLPLNIDSKNLVYLDMANSCIEQLWEGTEVHSSISALQNLVLLRLKNCKKFKSLPSSIDMKFLQVLDLSGCSSFEKFPEISGSMKELLELYLDETAIKVLPPSIEQFQRLLILSMRDCKNLACLPDNICSLGCLTDLTLSGCSMLKKLPDNLGNLTFLRNLEVEESGIEELPFSILHLEKLKTLSCRGCQNMRAPFSSWSASVKDHSIISKLLHLDLSDCNLQEVSDGIAHLSSLKTLDLRKNNLESLPEAIKELRSLVSLVLEACKSLKSLPELPPRINFIDAHDCIALATVSTLKPRYNSNIFIFSNCLQLFQSDLFRDTMETHAHYQDKQFSLHMSLPGNNIPEWFNHRNTGWSVTVQLPANWSHTKFLGFAICCVSNFKDSLNNAAALSAICHCTFKGNLGEQYCCFHLLNWGFETERFLESDHMFLGYVPWSDACMVSPAYSEDSFGEEENSAKNCFYTEAKFEIEVNIDNTCQLRTPEKPSCITSCGVHFYQGDIKEVQNLNTTYPQSDHDSCDVPFSPTTSKRKRENEKVEYSSLLTVGSATN